MMVIHSLKKIGNGFDDVNFDDPETKKYIEVRYIQTIRDVEKGIEHQIPFKSKICDEKDFSWSDKAIDIIK